MRGRKLLQPIYKLNFMKNFYSLRRVAFSTLSVLGTIFVMNAEETDWIDVLKYNIDEQTGVASVSGCKNSAINVEIPPFIEYNGKTYTVTSIGKEAFVKKDGLESVTIPNTITTIGISAFDSCTALSSVTIPKSVTTIEDGAFYYTTGLKSVKIDNAPVHIGASAFMYCSSLTELDFGNAVTGMGLYSFAHCSVLPSVSFSATTTDIGEGAFQNCVALNTVEIPASVEAIGIAAFAQTPAKITVDPANQYFVADDNFLYNKDKTQLLFCSTLTSGEIELPTTIKTIGGHAFQSCAKITGITLPESLTTIEAAGFHGCSGLVSLTIPETVTSIGDYAFQDCTNLTSITIPESVETLGSYSLSYCNALKSVKLPSTLTTLSDGLCSSCFSLSDITIPETVTNIGNSALGSCHSLKTIVIPAGVEKIGSSAFYDTPATEVYSYIENPFEIGNYDFSNYDATLYVPNGKKESYAATAGWDKFSNIVEMESGLNEVNTDARNLVSVVNGSIICDAEFEVFNINGVRVQNNNLNQGIYIVVVNGKSVKIAI